MTVSEICKSVRSREIAAVDAACNEIVQTAVLGRLRPDEIADLAWAIAESGAIIRLPDELAPFVDVPSTGGPASLVTLLCPLFLATAGARVPKISATGSVAGAIDSFALIPGFNTNLTPTEFVGALRASGFAHCAQSANICPADGRLVAIRRRIGAMKNGALAAISLLSKKLVVPGTDAVFDFRVGKSGNIADNFIEARAIADLFMDVASRLGVKIAIVFTDNSKFLCSGLGRLESLHIMSAVANNGQLGNPLDRDHLRTCVEIAAIGLALAGGGDLAASRALIDNRLSEGSVRRALDAHLAAQGARADGLGAVLEVRGEQRSVPVVSPRAGFWQAPDVESAKQWIKREQRRLDSLSIKHGDASKWQVGISLVARPGDRVQCGQVLLELRLPIQDRAEIITDGLVGEVSDAEPSPPTQLLGRVP